MMSGKTLLAANIQPLVLVQIVSIMSIWFGGIISEDLSMVWL